MGYETNFLQPQRNKAYGLVMKVSLRVTRTPLLEILCQRGKTTSLTVEWEKERRVAICRKWIIEYQKSKQCLVKD